MNQLLALSSILWLSLTPGFAPSSSSQPAPPAPAAKYLAVNGAGATYVPSVDSCITVDTLGQGIVLYNFHNNCASPVIFYSFSEDGGSDSDTILAHGHHAGLIAPTPYKFFACPYAPKSRPVEAGTTNPVSYSTSSYECLVL